MARSGRARAALGYQQESPDRRGAARAHRSADDRDVRRAVHRARAGRERVHLMVRRWRGLSLRADMAAWGRAYLLPFARSRDLSDLSPAGDSADPEERGALGLQSCAALDEDRRGAERAR